MIRSALIATCTLLLSLAPTARSQGYNYGGVCNAGIDADGFVDFSGLPPAPITQGGSSTAPIKAKMPVRGIPGLTVTVTIPSVGSTGENTSVYLVKSGVLNFPSNPGNGYVQLDFNKPIYGLAFEGIVAGRGGSFSLLTNEAGVPQNDPPNYQDTVANDELPPHDISDRLQAVGNISEAFLYFPYGTFGSPSILNVRVQSQPSPGAALVPRDGLQQWLMSEAAGVSFEPTLDWPDASGNHHDATQTSSDHVPGTVASGGPNCHGGFLFGGQSYFDFNLPIDGWEQMTVFLVARTFADPSPQGAYASMNTAILWQENALWGNTFVAPAQTSVPFRFGTEQVGNQPIYARRVDIGQDFTITRAVHDRSTDSLFVDSSPVLIQRNKRPVLAGTNGAAYLGRGINNTYFSGEISEVLVYNRVLSDVEASAVESYLRVKFGTR